MHVAVTIESGSRACTMKSPHLMHTDIESAKRIAEMLRICLEQTCGQGVCDPRGAAKAVLTAALAGYDHA